MIAGAGETNGLVLWMAIHAVPPAIVVEEAQRLGIEPNTKLNQRGRARSAELRDACLERLRRNAEAAAEREEGR